jgi:hypothetical protein
MLTRILDKARDNLAASQGWSSFKTKHPSMMRGLAYGYRAYRSYKHIQYHRIHRTMRPFTMLTRAGYINNLSLCDQYRTVPGSVVEFGTWKGGMIAGIAKLLGEKPLTISMTVSRDCRRPPRKTLCPTAIRPSPGKRIY